jgi:ABC-type branched-subunit amino acid transport system ATPase component
MASSNKDILVVDHLQVSYGQARAVQGISLSLGHGVLAVVGRNGMGKTSLCNAVTGMVRASGSVRFDGHEVLGMAPHQITRLGIGYVPQGRRVWRSLTVDEHLQLAARTARKGEWSVARVYEVFPRLAERRRNGGAQLSGGEQQMLAIARALLFNPRLLVMDEPTEGLAPVIVDQVAGLIRRLAAESDIPVLLIEQNLGVALSVAGQVAVMVNGRVATTVAPETLKHDRRLQESLLGVRSGGHADAVAEEEPAAGTAAVTAEVFRLGRAHKGPAEQPQVGVVPPPRAPAHDATGGDGEILVIGDSSEFGPEMAYLRGSPLQQRYRVRTVDITLGAAPSMADIGPVELERYAGARSPDIRAKADAIHAGLAQMMAARPTLRAVIALADPASAAALCRLLAQLPPELDSVMLTGPATLAAHPAPGALFEYRPLAAPRAVDRQRLELAIGALGGMLDRQRGPVRARA